MMKVRLGIYADMYNTHYYTSTDDSSQFLS